jgi:uncharacterized membrane protein HdeD (DUF308 family)
MKKNNWFMFVINGIIAVLFGALALFFTKETIETLTQYFGILVLVAGAILLIVAISNMKKEKPHVLLLAEAIAAILIGAVITFYPGGSLKLFLIMVGIWAAIIGLMQIILAIQMKNKVTNHSLFTINGIITLVMGLLLFFNPMGAVSLLMKIIGILGLAGGALLIYLGFKVKGAKSPSE